jgi:hypothetical protein
MRKFQSLQNLTDRQIDKQTGELEESEDSMSGARSVENSVSGTRSVENSVSGARSVENLKQVFEKRKQLRSVSFDASVKEHHYDQLTEPGLIDNTAIKDIISRYKNREPRRTALRAARHVRDSSDSSYTYSDSSIPDSSLSEDERTVHIPEKLV